ncbi:DNA recombination protein RmuC [Myxococcota bacterium]|nr:DNA recombination protein RmuC [Myxococcota bacterium]
MISLWILLAVAFGLIIGLGVGFYAASLLSKTKIVAVLEREKLVLGAKEEQLRELKSARDELSLQFKSLATDIMSKNSATFAAQNQKQIESVLTPLREQIKDFEKKVGDTYESDVRDRISLKKEIELLHTLNERISQDAINLTQALKGQNKTQGNWGELILQTVLEKSGLREGHEFESQVHLKSEDGARFHPDVVVHLPDERAIIIDSKVSLVAYTRFVEADDDARRDAAMDEHLASIRGHIKELSQKQYHTLEGVRSLDFVLLFIPNEPAFADALRADPTLFEEALTKNIVMVTPSTLLATLRTVENIWRYERQNQNAAEIAKKAGDLYDKFVGFVGDLENVDKKIVSLRGAYDSAFNKLKSGRGNLISRAEKLREMGIEANKKIPENLVE